MKNYNCKIYKRKEDCHYETAIWENGLPLFVTYGTTEQEADTKALIKLVSNNF